MQKDVILTPEGLENLKKEIEYLSTEKRREVAERIKEAREFGDISENSEYDDAKNEQAMLEARIASLEDKLRSASVIDASELSSDVVRVGSLVSVEDVAAGLELDAPGAVDEVEEGHLALAAAGGQPAGHTHLGVRLLAGFESLVRRLDAGDRRHAGVGVRERVDAGGAERLELAPPVEQDLGTVPVLGH